MARNGDADILIVHDKPSELKFMADGWGLERREFMYNDFLIVGPKDDPAGVAGMADAVTALEQIREKHALFVSRGDNSGTQKAELRLWAAAGLSPKSFDAKWYRDAGAGMGATLNIAAGMDAYTLVDRGTWLAFRNRSTLKPEVQGDPRLYNQYSVILDQPQALPGSPACQGAQACRLAGVPERPGVDCGLPGRRPAAFYPQRAHDEMNEKGLSDDCFAIGDALIPLDEALGRLRARLSAVVGVEQISLGEAAGRVLAVEVRACRDVPAFDNAAVDGFAFAHRDMAKEGETRLPLYGVARAGAAMSEPLAAGTAAEVFTGAPLPAGADTVVMIEDTRRDGHAVIFPAGVKPGTNVRRAGEDMTAGAVALEPGKRLRPQDLGVIAATGLAKVAVCERLRVAIFSTGNELVEPGEVLEIGGVYDANRPMLRAILQGWGFSVTDLGILPDEPARIRAALEQAAASHHVILSSGGASKSAEDHVVRVVGDLGRLDFWRIAVKPGRPMAFGRLGRAAYVGLPGNPVAAAVCLLRIARPALFTLAGAGWMDPVPYPLPAGFAMTKKPGRREFIRGSAARGKDGRVIAQRFARQGSGILTSLTAGNGLIELPEDLTRVEVGDPVDFIPYSDLLA